MMDLPATILITGTNKGIGYQLVKVFLKSNDSTIIYATSRETENAYKKWEELDPDRRVKCKYLDLSSSESIFSFASEIQKEKVRINILINNAGVCRTQELDKEVPTLQWAKQCLNINVIGQIQLTELLLSSLSEHCKIINICSTTGGLKHQPKQTQEKFSNPDLSKQDIIAAVSQYVKEVESNHMLNFSPNVYGTSKMLLGAWSRFVVQKKWLKGHQKSVCVTPGLCLTSMTEDMSETTKLKAHSSESGALKIYETINLVDLDSQIFYHRARRSNFMVNGEGLPRE